MKRIIVGCLVWAFSTLVLGTTLQNKVDNLINHIDPNMNIGIKVLDLNTGDILYQRNADRAFIPASNMKLFSDAAALLALGPDYRFRSQLSTDAPLLDKGILKGSIYLNLPGDPSFTREHLDALLSQLAVWNIQHIQGNVVLVSNNSSVNAYAPGWVNQDLGYSYGAPLGPLLLDENRLLVTVNPGAQVGMPALVEFDDHSASLLLNNQVKTTQKDTHCHIYFNMDRENRLTVRGCIGRGESAVQQRISIRNPLRYAQELVKFQLAKQHIILDGQVTLGKAPSSALLIASHDSKPISQLMADTLKPSDNLYADSLYLHTATKLHGTPLNWQEAQPIVKSFLQNQTKINMDQAVLIDGSGLSRYNLLTPAQTVSLLSYLYYRFPLSYEYISALPIAGQDGTLQRRLRKPTQQGLVRAKTGTLSGVVSLSGYLYTANGHTLAFSIFINRTPGTSPQVSGRFRPLIDTLCDFFLQQKIENNHVAQIQNPHARVAFQQQPTQADRQRNRYARWRQLEYAIKHALKDRPVTIIFRGNELILFDHEKDMGKVWSVLSDLRQKYAFAVALKSESFPAKEPGSPFVIWIRSSMHQQGPVSRIWTIREDLG